MESNNNQHVPIAPNFHPTISITNICEGKVNVKALEKFDPFKKVLKQYKSTRESHSTSKNDDTSHPSPNNSADSILIISPNSSLSSSFIIADIKNDDTNSSKTNVHEATNEQSTITDRIYFDPNRIAINNSVAIQTKKILFENIKKKIIKVAENYEKFTLSGQITWIDYENEWVPVNIKTSQNENTLHRDWRDNSKMALIMEATGSDKCCFVTICSKNGNTNISLIRKEFTEIKSALNYHFKRVDKFIDHARTLSESEFLAQYFCFNNVAAHEHVLSLRGIID